MLFPVTGKLLDACVLGLLEEKDTYGYDLTQKIGKSMEISETTLYPVLRRLLREGHLTAYDKAFDGRNRKYYHMTEEGKSLLEQYRQDWETHQGIISIFLNGGFDHD